MPSGAPAPLTDAGRSTDLSPAGSVWTLAPSPKYQKIDSPPDILSRRLASIWDGFFVLLPNFAIGLIVLVLFVFAGRTVGRVVRAGLNRRERSDLGTVLGATARWALVVFGVLVSATIIFPSIQPADLLSALGFGSVAIGFAFKDILQNWVAGLLILLRRPFRRGDQIRVKEWEGTVGHIDSRVTAIRTYDARRVIIPNADVYTNPVVIMTAFDPRRDEYDVGIGYGDDLDATCAVLLEALKSVSSVMRDPAPEAIAWELAGSSINIRLRWWSKPRRAELVETRGEVIAAVKRAAVEAGFDLPFPTQVVLWHDQTEDSDGDRKRQREGWPAGDSPPGPRRAVAVEIARIC